MTGYRVHLFELCHVYIAVAACLAFRLCDPATIDGAVLSSPMLFLFLCFTFLLSFNCKPGFNLHGLSSQFIHQTLGIFTKLWSGTSKTKVKRGRDSSFRRGLLGHSRWLIFTVTVNIGKPQSQSRVWLFGSTLVC
jgi:hypothetical protein